MIGTRHGGRSAALAGVLVLGVIAAGCGSGPPAGGTKPGPTTGATASASPSSAAASPTPVIPSPTLPTGVVRSVPVGLAPNWATFAFGSLWTANHHDDTVSRIDPASGKTLAAIPVGNGPGEVTAGFGSIWVTDYFEDGVDRIDPKSNMAIHIALGTHPGGGSTSCRAIAGFGLIWVADAGDVVLVSPETNQVAGAIHLMDHAGGEFYPCVSQRADGLIWTHGPNAHLLGIDPRTRKVVKTLPYYQWVSDGTQEWGLEPTPTFVDRVTKVDPRTGRRILSFTVPESDQNDLALSPGRVWIENNSTFTLREVDAKTGHVLQEIPTFGLAAGAVFARGLLWIPVFDKNALWAVRPK
jgi:YVTN family beta-propeller protein